MILNISDLIKRISTDVINVDFYENIKSLNLSGKIVEILEPIRVTGSIITDGKLASFSGRAEVLIKTECDRCLEEIIRNIVISIEEKFSNDSYSDDENEYYQMIDNKIDFTPVVEHNLLMNMPMKFLCKEDCKGIQSNSESRGEFSPFAELKDMFNKQGGR